MGEDGIIFSVDYPMASTSTGADWFRTVYLRWATKEKIARGTAERLLGNGPFGKRFQLSGRQSWNSIGEVR